MVDQKSEVRAHGTVADDDIFAPGVCRFRVVAMSALRPKDGFSVGVCRVILSGVSGLVLAAHAQAGGQMLGRNASEYAKIARCRTTEALSAALAPRS
jgi:hypothetical protein